MSKFKREFKNVVYNYTDAEAKVREATSNDPWGPSSQLMAELAEYTYHAQAYGLVMGMLWKRLNDHGKNWRHVYKSLTVLEYLIKTGSERVSRQCKDNLFSIQTLKDFQYVDKDGKDQGVNIREKAKALVSLLKDDNRLKEERTRAQQAQSRQTAISSNSSVASTDTQKSQRKVQFSESPTAQEGADGVRYVQNVEQARPGDATEEEMQLKLALQLSKQQADEEEKLKKQEEESLQAALELSKQDTDPNGEVVAEDEGTSSGNDLLLDFSNTVGISDPWAAQPSTGSEEPPPSYDTLIDPWATTTASTVGNSFAVSAPSLQKPANQIDPWSGTSTSSPAVSMTTNVPTADPWGLNSTTGPAAPDAFDLSSLNLPPISTTEQELPKSNRIEDQFLGDLGQLVDLDNLSSYPPPKTNNFGPSPSNPFGSNSSNPSQSLNPFDANKPPAPTLNQLAANQQPYGGPNLPPPLVPVGSAGNSPIHGRRQSPASNQYNPFS